MKQVVYIDVLLLTNLIVCYLILLASAAALKTKVKRLRLLAGALAGSVYSLSIFLPELSVAVTVPLRIAVLVVVTLIVFGYGGIRRFLRCFAVFIGINLLFAGLMLAIWLVFKPNNMIFSGGAVYFDISFTVLTVTAVICYCTVFLFSKLAGRKSPDNKRYIVELSCMGKRVICDALLDDGNLLTDSFTGKPVVVVYEQAVKRLLPGECRAYLEGDFTTDVSGISSEMLRRFRLIPCDTVTGSGLMPAFTIDTLTVAAGREKRVFSNVLIGITRCEMSNGEYSVLLNPMLFEEKGGRLDESVQTALPDITAI